MQRALRVVVSRNGCCSNVMLSEARRQSFRPQLRHLPITVRSLSLWPSKSASPSPAPDAVIPTPPVEPQASITEQAVPIAEAATTAVDAVTPEVVAAAAPVTAAAAATTVSTKAAMISASVAALKTGGIFSMGLAGWGPVGLLRSGMLALHYSAGVDWFWVFVGGAAFSRIIVFPFMVLSQKTNGGLRTNQVAIKTAQEEVERAKRAKDPIRMQRAAVKMRDTMKGTGFTMGSTLVGFGVPMIWSIFTVVAAYGLLWHHPAAAASGMWLFPNLHAPTSIGLAAAMGGLIFIQTRMSMAESYNPMMPDAIKMQSAMSIMAPLMFVVMGPLSGVSTGMTLVAMSTSSSMILQSAILRLPAVRARLGLPPLAAIPILPESDSIFGQVSDTFTFMAKKIQGFVETIFEAVLEGPGKKSRKGKGKKSA
ncbi:hypothetical protein CYLTODRAFT_446353 [Cylindrobasidium torrendii FP15055 ss-10]|uniref:Uncharacterized protein n=1 Tax=Cylindrobasidium torrendii FP15055 ss-10 TaxID=1314674 RepID=A0A0D7B091_9AGAR|nr:hypothetical protein CYLTODRAFT_446353 [Cylindrobasidium torrendii FP15055 ss-10]